MKCIISTSTDTKTYSNLVSVTVPTSKGIAQIKPGHAEYITNTVTGEILCVTKSQKSVKTQVQEGVCRVTDDTVIIVV